MAAAIAFGQQISREYIRLGGRVIAIENYGSLEVTVSAPASRVGPGETLQFNASGGGASNGVSWSLDPPAPDGGQITTPGGLYTAPGSIIDPRTVKVKATSVADGTSSGTFNLTLNPVLLPGSLQIGASGGAGNVKVTKQGTWTATSSMTGTGDDWLRITSTQQDAAGGDVNFTVAANSGQQRTASLTIAGQNFGVTQYAADASISLGSTILNPEFQYSGGQQLATVTVTGGATWTAVASDASWILLPSNATATNTTGLTFSCTILPTIARRTGTITIGGSVISITQLARPTISPTSNSFPSGGGTGTITIAAETNATWSATVLDNWVSLTSPASGRDNGQVTYAVAANTSTNLPRQATITIADQQHTITQAAAAAPLEITPSIAYSVFVYNQVQFNAYLDGSTTPQNNAVTWDPPAAGTITESGLYQAPSSIPFAQTVTITARRKDGLGSDAAEVRLELYYQPSSSNSLNPSTGDSVGATFLLTFPNPYAFNPEDYSPVELLFTRSINGVPAQDEPKCYVTWYLVGGQIVLWGDQDQYQGGHMGGTPLSNSQCEAYLQYFDIDYPPPDLKLWEAIGFKGNFGGFKGSFIRITRWVSHWFDQ